MDFAEIKKEALKLKNKAEKAGKSMIKYSAGKLADSGFTLKTQEELEVFIEKSKNTSGTDSETGKKKEFPHRVIIIFMDTKSDFFRHMLYQLPVLQTKAFTQSTQIKLADVEAKDIDAKKYKVSSIPALVVFENMEHYKTVSGEENIQNLVKSLSLDINKAIEEL